MKRDLVTKVFVFGVLVSLAVAIRVVSETPNFSAVAAASLFAGFYFRHVATAVAVPLLTMTVSDQFIGGYAKGVMIAVYASLLIPIAWRAVLRARLTPLRVGAGAISSSLAFYLFSNAAVWYAWHPHTWQEMAHCYALALPFFVNTLTSDMAFSACFFGLYALAMRYRAPTPSVAPGTV